MFETFKAIKDDPRSSTGVFRAGVAVRDDTGRIIGCQGLAI